MSERMAKLDRVLTLVHALADANEGLTLDEMAEVVGVNRRTAERLRDVIALHFDLDDSLDDRRKRFRIRGSLRRTYTRPNAIEIAALQTEADARKREGAPQAQLLDSLLAKIKAAFDDKEKSRIGPDLEPLVKFQTTMFQPGPRVEVEAEVLAAVQQAMIAGTCLEFDYLPDGANDTKWRQVVPLGVIHGPTTYLVGKFPDRDFDPAIFRLDRMSDAHLSEVIGVQPDDWDLDAWMEQSASIWREEEYDIVLRVLPDGVERARNWCFHPQQVIEEDGDCLIIRFRAGGLWQIADHVFTWRGDLVIVGPEALREEMRDRIAVVLLSEEESSRRQNGGANAFIP